MSEYSHCNRERTDVQCRARIEEITKKNMGQDTKVDENDAFARFQRNKTTFKEKNKVEIKLDSRYAVNDSIKITIVEKKEEEKPDENGWTQTQQKALEALVYCLIMIRRAMKKYPASMDKNERWVKIAEEVEGKTKNDCIKRVKWIREQLLKKKCIVCFNQTHIYSIKIHLFSL